MEKIDTGRALPPFAGSIMFDTETKRILDTGDSRQKKKKKREGTGQGL